MTAQPIIRIVQYHWGNQNRSYDLNRKINDWVYQPFNVNRCHCYGLRGRKMIERTYKHLNHFENWKSLHHVDHYLGELHKQMKTGLYVREDRRHINDTDLRRLRETVWTKLNLEMSLNPKIVETACAVVPDQATLVLEKRREVTTEGGLDVCAEESRVKETIARLHEKGIRVSLFLDPEEKQIEAAKRCGSDAEPYE